MPYEEYLNADYCERVYSEIASATVWNTIQCEYPEEVTVLPCIISSDSTHLTNFSGDKKMKPVIISNAHIRQHVRAAPSRRAFMCIAFIPEGKFNNIEFKSKGQRRTYPGILKNRLYHTCMTFVMSSLRLYTHT